MAVLQSARLCHNPEPRTTPTRGFAWCQIRLVPGSVTNFHHGIHGTHGANRKSKTVFSVYSVCSVVNSSCMCRSLGRRLVCDGAWHRRHAVVKIVPFVWLVWFVVPAGDGLGRSPGAGRGHGFQERASVATFARLNARTMLAADSWTRTSARVYSPFFWLSSRKSRTS